MKHHKMSGTPEHNAWKSMRRRCLTPSNPAFKDYAGRGIGICNEWSDFKQFLADMGKRPSPLHSLDRIDNDEGYRPDNCRWATKKEQSDNRRPMPNKTGYTGVAKFKNGGFMAQVWNNGKLKYLGTFDTAQEASAVYQTARGEL